MAQMGGQRLKSDEAGRVLELGRGKDVWERLAVPCERWAAGLGKGAVPSSRSGTVRAGTGAGGRM